MKAVTPVIATVMLMLITVGMVGMTYTWFSNMMTTQTEKNIAIPVGGVQCINNRVSVIVTNAGANSNITDDDIVIADVNGVSVRNTPFFGGFNTNGLVGYWRFENESSDGRYAYDYSSYGNTGTLTSMNVTGNATSGWNDTCRFGKCLNFDGVNDYVSVNTGASLDSFSAFTVGTWSSVADFSAESGYYRSLLTRTRDDNNRYVLAVSSNRFLVDVISGGTRYYVKSNYNLQTNTFYYFTTTWDGQALKVYVNGVDVSTAGEALSPGNAGETLIGSRRSDVGRFAGTIDEVSVWNRALSADEITQLNKTNSGNFTMAPNRAITLINRYPVFAKGKYTVRVGTRNSVIERTVECV